jgi:tRNA(Met) C34 N-acetyltransferase TmcA
LRALSPAAEELFVIARQRFDQQFFHELPVIFNDLDAQLVIEILNKCNVPMLEMDNQDWLDVESFAEGFRQFELCRSIIGKLVVLGFTHHAHYACLTPLEQSLLIKRVLQNQTIKDVNAKLGFTGKHQQVLDLRHAVKKLSDVLKKI